MIDSTLQQLEALASDADNAYITMARHAHEAWKNRADHLEAIVREAGTIDVLDSFEFVACPSWPEGVDAATLKKWKQIVKGRLAHDKEWHDGSRTTVRA